MFESQGKGTRSKSLVLELWPSVDNSMIQASQKEAHIQCIKDSRLHHDDDEVMGFFIWNQIEALKQRNKKHPDSLFNLESFYGK